jgi:hypothetical protein
MDFWGWLADNSFNLISAIGVISGLCFTAASLRSDTKTKQIANLLTITANHREIWKDFIENPKLVRVRDPDANVSKEPITNDERVFVALVIQHLNSVYYAISDQLVIKYRGLSQDIKQFLSLPIPRSVWESVKPFQNDDFVEFVEDAMK